MAGRSSRTRGYRYTLIRDLIKGNVYNIYGVVSSIKGPNYTPRNHVKYISMWVMDESCSRDEIPHITCIFYYENGFEFPDFKIGDIVRFHRMRVISHQGFLQGKTSTGFSWAVYSRGDVRYSHENHTPIDHRRVNELKDLISNSSLLNPNAAIIRISDIPLTSDRINMVVQVVAVHPSPQDRTCAIVVCWDGTFPKVRSQTYCTMGDKMHMPNENLENNASGMTVKILCYDNFKEEALQLLPGQIIMFASVHVKILHEVWTENYVAACGSEVGEDDKRVVLVMHRGHAWGRKIVILEESDREYQRLKELLPPDDEEEVL